MLTVFLRPGGEPAKSRVGARGSVRQTLLLRLRVQGSVHTLSAAFGFGLIQVKCNIDAFSEQKRDFDSLTNDIL